MYALPERPMNVFQVIKHAGIFWAKTLNAVLPLTLLYGILMAAVNYYKYAPAEQFPHPALKILISLVGSLLGLIILAAVLIRMNSELTGKPVLLMDAIFISTKRFISLIYFYFITIFTVGLPFALLAIIGHFLHSPFNIFFDVLALLYILIAMIYLFVSFTLVAAEDVIATTAIKQSYQSVKQQWWHTFFIAILLSGMMIVLELVLLLLTHNIPFATFIPVTFISSFVCSVLLIQLHHLRAYHKLHDSPAN